MKKVILSVLASSVLVGCGSEKFVMPDSGTYEQGQMTAYNVDSDTWESLTHVDGEFDMRKTEDSHSSGELETVTIMWDKIYTPEFDSTGILSRNNVILFTNQAVELCKYRAHGMTYEMTYTAGGKMYDTTAALGCENEDNLVKNSLMSWGKQANHIAELLKEHKKVIITIDNENTVLSL